MTVLVPSSPSPSEIATHSNDKQTQRNNNPFTAGELQTLLPLDSLSCNFAHELVFPQTSGRRHIFQRTAASVGNNAVKTKKSLKAKPCASVALFLLSLMQVASMLSAWEHVRKHFKVVLILSYVLLLHRMLGKTD